MPDDRYCPGSGRPLGSRQMALVSLALLVFLLPGCADSHSSARVAVGSPLEVTRPYRPADVETARAWINEHGGPPARGGWSRGVILSFRYDGDWSAAVALPNGHVKALVADGDVGRMLAVAAPIGTYLRFHPDHGNLWEPEDVRIVAPSAVPLP